MLTYFVYNPLEEYDLVNDIASAAQEQASGAHQVNVAIGEMDKVTQQNAALVEESSAASVNLAHEASSLSDLVRMTLVMGQGE